MKAAILNLCEPLTLRVKAYQLRRRIVWTERFDSVIEQQISEMRGEQRQLMIERAELRTQLTRIERRI